MGSVGQPTASRSPALLLGLIPLCATRRPFGAHTRSVWHVSGNSRKREAVCSKAKRRSSDEAPSRWSEEQLESDSEDETGMDEFTTQMLGDARWASDLDQVVRGFEPLQHAGRERKQENATSRPQSMQSWGIVEAPERDVDAWWPDSAEEDDEGNEGGGEEPPLSLPSVETLSTAELLMGAVAVPSNRIQRIVEADRDQRARHTRDPSGQRWWKFTATGKGSSEEESAHRLRGVQRGALSIVGGGAANTPLYSPTDPGTRPMMAMAKRGLFDTLAAIFGALSNSPLRWLDLYSGTGGVALEALSRFQQATALCLEADPWVVRRCLQPNARLCNVQDRLDVRCQRVEEFLLQTERAPHAKTPAAKPFDVISVCPPYDRVDYPLILKQVGDSPLLHQDSYVIVEYSKQLAMHVGSKLGHLACVRKKKYGRTRIAIFGAANGHK